MEDWTGIREAPLDPPDGDLPYDDGMVPGPSTATVSYIDFQLWRRTGTRRVVKTKTVRIWTPAEED